LHLRFHKILLLRTNHFGARAVKYKDHFLNYLVKTEIILCASTFSRDFLLGKIHSGACAQKIKRLLWKLSRENGGA